MLALTLSAELDGVTQLRPADSQDAPFHYTFIVQCTSCREIHPNWVTDSNELSGSRGEANFVWRCKNCKREHSANIKDAPKPYQQSSPTPGIIIEIDCRGLEFVEFSPEGEWAAQGEESGTPFVGIDLQEGDWYDFDEKASREVSITELKWDIRRV